MSTLQTIDIEAALYTWLISKPTTGMDPTRRLAKLAIRSMVSSAIFASRRPKNAHVYQYDHSDSVELAITLERSRVGREYVLDGESEYAQPTVTVITYARRNPRASMFGKRLAEYIRIATSGFWGTWTYPSDKGRDIPVSISGCTITSETELPPLVSTGAGDKWDFRYSVQYEITHRQTPGVFGSIVKDDPLNPPPPPPPPGPGPNQGIGFDVIGETIVR